VVRHQGFANAQRELNLSTSAISTYMSQLEGAWVSCCATVAGVASA
jgi:DNA-binding transcriptional LysR family regulator